MRAQRDARRGQSPSWGHLCSPVLPERGEGTCLPGARPSLTHPMSIPQPPRVDAVPSWRRCQDAAGTSPAFSAPGG